VPLCPFCDASLIHLLTELVFAPVLAWILAVTSSGVGQIFVQIDPRIVRFQNSIGRHVIGKRSSKPLWIFTSEVYLSITASVLIEKKITKRWMKEADGISLAVRNINNRT